MEYVAQHIPTMSIAGIIFSIIVAFGLPIGLLIFWRKKTRADIAPFLVGCCVFVVFVNVLESAFHSIILTVTGTALTDNVLWYALYGGLAAGVFEECGRFIAMKCVMKKYLNKKNAIMYGMGHGGIEAILLLGTASISNLVMSLMINAGQLETLLSPLDDEIKKSTFESLSSLWTADSYMFFMGSIERVSAITLHICMSYVVYRAVKDHNIKWLFAAIGVHFLVDAGTICLTRMLNMPVWLFEALLLCLMAALGWHIYKVYNAQIDSPEDVVVDAK